MLVARTLAAVLAWAVVVVTAAVLVTQVAGWTRSRHAAALQALTPVLGALSLLAAILGRVWSSVPLIVVGILAAVGVGTVVAPAARRRGRGPASSGAAAITVLH